MRKLNFTVGIDSISPDTAQFGGVQGEHNATEIEITLTNELVSALNALMGEVCYRIDIVDGAGVHYLGEPMVYDGETSIIYELHQAATAQGGNAEIRLVFTEYDENETKKLLYTFGMRLYFEPSFHGDEAEVKAVEDLSGLALKAEDCASRAERSAVLAKNAAYLAGQSLEEIDEIIFDTLDDLKESGEFDGADGKDGIPATHRWNGTVLTITSASGTSSADLKGEKGESGVFVGVGDMPDGYDIQIDPSGETLSVVDEITSSTSDELPNCKAVKNYVASVGGTATTVTTESSLYGKKIVYDGDSICIGTYGGGGYAKLIADKVGGSYINQAVGGARLQTQEGSSGNFHSIVDNLTNLPTDGDLYCFEGGINDYWTKGILGTYDYENFGITVDESGVVVGYDELDTDLDLTTVCGALEKIFRYALRTFVGKPICFIITHKIQRTAYNANSNGDTFKDYHDAMVGICEKYSIPYYDAFNESGLNGWNLSQNNAFLTGNSKNEPDGCHPNEEGYKRYYVPQLISLFESIMPIETTSIGSSNYTNILNTVGYTVDKRLSGGNGELKDNTGSFTTGFIPVSAGDTIYLKNIEMNDHNDGIYENQVAGFKSDGSFVFVINMITSLAGYNVVSDGTNVTQFTVTTTLLGGDSSGSIRICVGNIDETSIITVNEPI